MLQILKKYQKGSIKFKVIKMFHGGYVVQVLGSGQTQRLQYDVVEEMLKKGEIKVIK